MKKSVLIYLLLISSVYTFAQDTITNFGLNTWENLGKPTPYYWDEPKGWTSSNHLTEAFNAGVTRVQLPQSGSSQALLKTLNIFGRNIPGIIINGDLDISIEDTIHIPLLGGEPMTTVKHKAYGLYNFTSSDITDSATIIIAFKKFNNNTNQPVAVALGTISLAQTQSGLYPFIIDVQTITNDQPDSVVVTILSSNISDIRYGGELTVDFVQFSQPTGILPVSSASVKVYPNPAKNEVFIELPNANGAEYTNYTITDVLGKQITMGTIANNSPLQKIDVDQLSKGYYFIQLSNNVEAKTFKFIKE